jgi:hypothetical protein
MATAADGYWFAELAQEAERRGDQPSFHLFAEGTHSDLRGQIVNLDADGSYELPFGKLPHHLFVLVGVAGTVEAVLPDARLTLRPLSQLVVLPGVPCVLTACTDASFEVLSFLASVPSKAAEAAPRGKGEFYLGKTVRTVLWFLHEVELPGNLNWARLRVFDDGSADCTFSNEGVAFAFVDERSAVHLLTEDEYVCFSRFDDEDDAEYGTNRRTIVPPTWVDAPDKPFEYLGTY